MKQLVKNIFSILSKKERQHLYRLAVADIFVNILDIVFLIGLLVVINFYTQSGDSRINSFLHYPILKHYPLLLITLFFVLFSIKNFAGFVAFKQQYNFVYAVASRISGDNVLHYLHGSYADHVLIDSSVYQRKISQQPIEFCHYVLSGLQQVFSQAVLILITVIAILFFNPLLFPLLILILIPPVLLIALFMKRKLMSVREHGKITSEKAIQHLQEALTGYVESNVYGKNDFFENRYHGLQAKLNHYLAEKQVIQNMPSRLIEVFAVFGLFFLIVLNAVTTDTSSIRIVTIGAFMAAAYKVIPGIVKIMNTMGQVKTYAFTVTDLLHSRLQQQKNNTTVTPIDSAEFKNIYFDYGQKKVLTNFSLTINKGDLIGISGSSGKGKTTIINLLLGFLTPASGDIYFNDKITTAEERKNYWKSIAYSKQQPFFIHDTLLKNILLDDNDYDKERLTAILAVTGIDKLTTTGKGLETIIAENGKNFSGGQRQRIIFARTLYKNAELLILDEPFNELDELSENNMLQHLQQLAAEGKTIILITHNKAALSFCNKKFELNGYNA